MKIISLKHMGMLCIAAGILLSGSLYAQDSNPLLTARVIKVATGKANEFVELQRQFTEARKKAGSPGRWVWQEVRGDSSTYHVVTLSDDYASFDESSESPLGEAGWATWVSRISQTIDKREVVTVRLYPELEIKPKAGQEPNLLVLTERVVAQGKNGVYRTWLEDKLVPALRKAGVTGVSYGKTAMGGNIRAWTSASHVASWSELDEPWPLASLSSQDRQTLFEDVQGIVESAHTIVLRYRADMSHNDPE